jgi:serine phosphatase RsbU (regulator of sigma subunit)/anti-sigma regulatory factor (Ser/Thr protein kinase)
MGAIPAQRETISRAFDAPAQETARLRAGEGARPGTVGGARPGTEDVARPGTREAAHPLEGATHQRTEKAARPQGEETADQGVRGAQQRAAARRAEGARPQGEETARRRRDERARSGRDEAARQRDEQAGGPRGKASDTGRRTQGSEASSRVKGSEASPRATGSEARSRRKATDKSSRAAGSNASSRVTSSNGSPRTEGSSASPRAKSSNTSPGAKSGSASPRTTGGSTSPRATSRDTSPRATSRDTSPRAQSRDASSRAESDARPRPRPHDGILRRRDGDTLPRASGDVRPCAQARATLPGSPLAPGAARAFVRAALTEWTAAGLAGTEYLTDRLVDDAVVAVSELVTNAVVHAGTDVALSCRLEGDTGALVVEVLDHHPSRAPRDSEAEASYETPEYGRGLRLVARLAESWGVTYRTGAKTVWARLPAEGADAGDGMEAYAGNQAVDRGLRVAQILAPEPPAPASAPASPIATAYTPVPAPVPAPETPPGQEDPCRVERDREWLNRGALSFLAEASDLLAGQLDENLVAALAGQLIVPRLADWCAVWLEDEVAGRWGSPRSGEADSAGGFYGAGGRPSDGITGTGPRLARVWHGSENLIEELRRALEREPPRPLDPPRTGPAPYPWPGEALGPGGEHGAALAYRLVAGGRPLGTLVIGRAALVRFPDEITGLVEDLSRRVALAIGAARQYARQATISRVLQRGLLPGAVAEIPGVHSALVYEPCDKGGPSGDFYDLFPAGDGRWCFALGDVQGKGPEAAVVIGIARPWLRLLAREGYRVADVLDRLNQLLLDDATEAADAAARALVGPVAPGDGPQTRFLSLLYGELTPFDGGVRCTLASAGHPLPLILDAAGEVHTAAQPQTLLGVIEDATYTSETLELRPGDSLLCVTDGVTERRCGSRQFDDGDGLATALAGCEGLSAQLIADRISGLVHEFGGRPPEDDLALLVLQAQ